MMPQGMPPQGGPPGMPPPSAPPAGGPPDQGMPQPGGGDVQGTLLQVLRQAKRMADSAGIDFAKLVAQVSGGGNAPAGPKGPPPVPPKGGRPAPPTPGAVPLNPASTKQNSLY
jgi:hypothetical protein